MPKRIDDKLVRKLEAPESGNRITYDDEVPGFGVRITANGARSFVLNYRVTGRERRYTIGEYGPWSVVAARKKAEELRKLVSLGQDPLAERIEAREAETVADMCRRFEEEHLPKTRPSTAAEYRALIATRILPAIRHVKVADVTYSDIDALHRNLSKTAPYRANRTVAVLSKMFALAVRWQWRSDNPAKGIERNQETKRHHYLSGEELGRLTLALADYEDQQAANIVRMLLLTGARRGEVLAMRWDQISEDGIWTKPGSTTKQKTEHRVPLSAPARQLLAGLRRAGEYVFPNRGGEGHRLSIKNDWAALCEAGKITGARIHDLRHTYASVLASAGLSLPVIGALLGHSQPATTARYSHLFDDPLRAATERVGAIVMGKRKPAAKVISLGNRRS